MNLLWLVAAAWTVQVQLAGQQISVHDGGFTLYASTPWALREGGNVAHWPLGNGKVVAVKCHMVMFEVITKGFFGYIFVEAVAVPYASSKGPLLPLGVPVNPENRGHKALRENREVNCLSKY